MSDSCAGKMGMSLPWYLDRLHARPLARCLANVCATQNRPTDLTFHNRLNRISNFCSKVLREDWHFFATNKGELVVSIPISYFMLVISLIVLLSV